MARGRMIDKEISLDEKVDALPDDSARLLWTWLIPHLDREGRMYGDANLVKSIVVPRLNWPLVKVEKYLKAIEKLGLIRRYEVNGNQYLDCPNFAKHQKGLELTKEAASRLPVFTDEIATYSRPTRDLLATDPAKNHPEGEYKGIEVEENIPPIVPQGTLNDKGNEKKLVLPDWIKSETWSAFKEMRQKSRAPLTNNAAKLLLNKLARFRDAGDDPNLVLEQSIMSGYRGVFPLKQGGGNGSNRNDTKTNSRQIPARYTSVDEAKRQWIAAEDAARKVDTS